MTEYVRFLNEKMADRATAQELASAIHAAVQAVADPQFEDDEEVTDASINEQVEQAISDLIEVFEGDPKLVILHMMTGLDMWFTQLRTGRISNCGSCTLLDA